MALVMLLGPASAILRNGAAIILAQHLKDFTYTSTVSMKFMFGLGRLARAALSPNISLGQIRDGKGFQVTITDTA